MKNDISKCILPPKKVFTNDPTKLNLIDPGDDVEFFEISKKEYSKFNEQK